MNLKKRACQFFLYMEPDQPLTSTETEVKDKPVLVIQNVYYYDKEGDAQSFTILNDIFNVVKEQWPESDCQ